MIRGFAEGRGRKSLVCSAVQFGEAKAIERGRAVVDKRELRK